MFKHHQYVAVKISKLYLPNCDLIHGYTSNPAFELPSPPSPVVSSEWPCRSGDSPLADFPEDSRLSSPSPLELPPGDCSPGDWRLLWLELEDLLLFVLGWSVLLRCLAVTERDRGVLELRGCGGEAVDRGDGDETVSIPVDCWR